MENLRKEFADILKLNEDEIITCKKLAGLSNENYLFETKSGDFVYRKAHKTALISRKNELENLKLVQDFDAKLIYFDEKTGDKISEYLPNAKTLKIPLSDEMLVRLAHKIAKLHVKKVRFAGQFDLIKECKKYEYLLLDNILHVEFLVLKNEFLKEYKSFEFSLDICPSHNDLVCENILHVEDELYIIDWEYATLNHPSWDVAVLFLEADFKADQEREFLDVYLAQKNLHVDKKSFEKQIKVQKKAYKIICYLWAMSKGEEFLEYAKDCLEFLKNS